MLQRQLPSFRTSSHKWITDERQYSFWMRITVPTTSLCPCSKENFESIHNHSAFARIARTSSAVEPAQSGKRRDQHLHLLSTGTTR